MFSSWFNVICDLGEILVWLQRDWKELSHYVTGELSKIQKYMNWLNIFKVRYLGVNFVNCSNNWHFFLVQESHEGITKQLSKGKVRDKFSLIFQNPDIFESLKNPKIQNIDIWLLKPLVCDRNYLYKAKKIVHVFKKLLETKTWGFCHDIGYSHNFLLNTILLSHSKL